MFPSVKSVIFFKLKRSSFFSLIVIVVMLFDDILLDDGQDEVLIQAADRGERQAQHQIQLGGNPLATQRGRFRFVPEPLHERRSQKFGVHERVVRLRPVQEGRLIPQQQLTDALKGGLRRAVEQVLDQQKVPDTAQFYISLASDRLRSASNAFHLTAQEWPSCALIVIKSDGWGLSTLHVRGCPRTYPFRFRHVGPESKREMWRRHYGIDLMTATTRDLFEQQPTLLLF